MRTDERARGSVGVRMLLLALALLPLGTQPGCTDVPERTGDVRTDLRSHDPQVRGHAALLAGRQRDTSSVPQLIELLMDDEYSVRLNAFFALNLIVGTKDEFGYKALDPASRRAAATDRYREWWATTTSPAP